MIRRPPRSTQGVSSAASDVYKRQDRESALGVSSTNLDGVGDECRPDNPENSRHVYFVENSGVHTTVHIHLHIHTHNTRVHIIEHKTNNGWLQLNASFIEKKCIFSVTHLVTHTQHTQFLKSSTYGGRRPDSPPCAQSCRGSRVLQTQCSPNSMPESTCGQVYRGPCTAYICLLYTSPSPRDGLLSRMPSSA